MELEKNWLGIGREICEFGIGKKKKKRERESDQKTRERRKEGIWFGYKMWREAPLK